MSGETDNELGDNEMTIRELYNWAKENKYLDNNVGVINWDRCCLLEHSEPIDEVYVEQGLVIVNGIRER